MHAIYPIRYKVVYYYKTFQIKRYYIAVDLKYFHSIETIMPTIEELFLGFALINHSHTIHKNLNIIASESYPIIIIQTSSRKRIHVNTSHNVH